jgi:hypothetical protein
MSHVAVAAHGIVWGRNQGPFRPKLLATALKIKKTEVFGSLSGDSSLLDLLLERALLEHCSICAVPS